MRLIQGLPALFFLCFILSISAPVVLAEEAPPVPITLVAGKEGPPLVGPPATVLAMGSLDYFVSDAHFSDTESLPPQLWRSDGKPSGTHFLTRWRYGYPGQAVFAELGLWILSGSADMYLSFVPYTNHTPVLHHNLGSHHVMFPQLQAGNALYVTGRLELPVGPSFLFRIDPAWAAPPAQHLPVVASP